MTLKQLGKWARDNRVTVRISYAVRKAQYVALATHWKTDLVKVEHEDVEKALTEMVARVEKVLPFHHQEQAKKRKMKRW